MIQWNDPLEFIHGLSAAQRRVLKKLDVKCVGDLLSIVPRRYDDYSHLATIAKIPIGQPVTIRVTVKEIKRVPTFRQRFVLIKALVSDASGSIGVTWFNQPWLLSTLHPGDEIFLSGVATYRPRFGRGFTSPLWEPATEETLAAGTIAPVYPLTGSLTQKTLRTIIRVALEDVAPPPDVFSDPVRDRFHLTSVADAIRWMHRPDSLEHAERARQRFAFEELLNYQLALGMARQTADVAGAPQVTFDQSFAKRFVATLPFELTPDQKRAIWAMVKDLEESRPMRRLLQGDVGSGKTAVAAMLSALTVRAGASAAIMAPTEILAKQHAATFERFFAPHQLSVMLLTSKTRRLCEAGETRSISIAEAKERLTTGRLAVIGTHALLERDQTPSDLALAIVDEQHRFGVAQREALMVMARQDGKVPHLLSMSATPIPRSLALSMLGDLAVSVIRTKPAGRKPIETHVLVGDEARPIAYERIRSEAALGRRTFIVCAMIDASDVMNIKNVQQEAERLRRGSLNGLRIGIVHGGLATSEKDEVMNGFASGLLDVLIATTVVEVGVDVPEATTILIENADRFGLAQLHQLRGRVGRSSLPSMCFLAIDEQVAGIERLHVLEQTNDGFRVAEADLEQRGEGNILGMQQSGVPLFSVARATDVEVMSQAREYATELLSQDSSLEAHPLLRERVTELQETTHRE